MKTSAILEQWAAALKEPWRQPLRVLKRSAAALQRKANADPSTFRYVDPAALLRTVCLRTREAAAANNVALLVHCACGTVRLQPEPFADFLFDLLVDAISATSSRPVLVSVRGGGEGDVMWQIRDTADRRPARCPLWRTILDRHAGLLQYDSAPASGTSASVWLPPNAGRRPIRRASVAS